MKKVAKYVVLVIILILLSAYSKPDIPKKIANSAFLIRRNIRDYGGTVGKYFLNREFRVDTLLDGDISTFKYGEGKLNGNTYKLVINKLVNNSIRQQMNFYLDYQSNNTTYLSKIILKDFTDGSKRILEKFNEKYALLTMLEEEFLVTNLNIDVSFSSGELLSDYTIIANGDTLQENEINQPGIYNIKVISEGYETISKKINLKKGQSKTIDFNLDKKYGYLNVKLLSGSQIYLQDNNGNKLSKWDSYDDQLIKKVKPGDYELSIKYPNAKFTKNIEVTNKDTTFLVMEIGRIKFNITPMYTKVSIYYKDEKNKLYEGRVPDNYTLAKGNYILKFSPGFKAKQDTVKNIKIVPNKVINIMMTFEEKKSFISKFKGIGVLGIGVLLYSIYMTL